MDELIDLDAPFATGPASLLRRQPASFEEKRNAILWGGFVGLLISLIPASILWTIFSLSSENDTFGSGPGLGTAYTVAEIAIVAGTLIGAWFMFRRLANECRNGFLKVGIDRIQYWNRKGVVTHDLGLLFGAGPVGEPGGRRFRLCNLSGGIGGYDTAQWNFKRYEVVEGPMTGMVTEDSDGDVLARQVIQYYINKRRDAGMPVAGLPAYAFKSVMEHRRYLVLGPMVVDHTFSCDGKILSWAEGEEILTMSVAAVREVVINYVSGKYGPTKWVINLLPDPSSGNETLKLDILNMSNADQIQRYCLCLPTLF
jgi:hypothetical protein